MSKKEAQLEGMSNPLMVAEFFAIVCCQHMEGKIERLKESRDGCGQGFCTFAPDLGQQAQARFALGEGDEGVLMPFADHGIHFPIPEPGATRHNGRSLLNGHAVAEVPPTIVRPIALAATPLTTQMAIEGALRAFVLEDMLVIHS